MSGEMSPNACFVTENVEPHMNVMRSKYRSALGKRRLALLVAVVVLFISSCGEKGRTGVLPDEKLAHIYAGMAFIKELYAGNPIKYELALDSLMRANDTDTLTVRRSFEELSKDPEELDKVYTEALNILDAKAKTDSASMKQRPVFR